MIISANEVAILFSTAAKSLDCMEIDTVIDSVE